MRDNPCRCKSRPFGRFGLVWSAAVLCSVALVSGCVFCRLIGTAIHRCFALFADRMIPELPRAYDTGIAIGAQSPGPDSTKAAHAFASVLFAPLGLSGSFVPLPMTGLGK